MKTTKSIFAGLSLLLLVSTSAMAQSKAKVIAVVNKASWCHVCEENGGRAMEAFKNSNSDGTVQFVGNNLTNEETKKKSAKELKKLGLEKAMSSHKGTGLVYFFNAESKALITKISVAKSDAELAQALVNAKKSL